jgi:hypothetical protein
MDIDHGSPPLESTIQSRTGSADDGCMECLPLWGGAGANSGIAAASCSGKLFTRLHDQTHKHTSNRHVSTSNKQTAYVSASLLEPSRHLAGATRTGVTGCKKYLYSDRMLFAKCRYAIITLFVVGSDELLVALPAGQIDQSTARCRALLHGPHVLVKTPMEPPTIFSQ